MADPKYKFFNISAYISLRIMILVSTYTLSETRIPLKLISNHFQPQLVSIGNIENPAFWVGLFEKMAAIGTSLGWKWFDVSFNGILYFENVYVDTKIMILS